jgi:hypothetical protein
VRLVSRPAAGSARRWCDERQVRDRARAARALVDDLLLLDALVLHLEEEVVRAEDVAQPAAASSAGRACSTFSALATSPLRQLLSRSALRVLRQQSLSMRGR